MSIVSKEVSFIAERLREKNISMQTRKTVHKFILNKIKTEKLHARNVKVIVKKLLQTPIARFVIENKNVEKISLKVVDKNIKVY
jgi:ATP-dependent Clp protease ATP-binding subunit ClpA